MLRVAIAAAQDVVGRAPAWFGASEHRRWAELPVAKRREFATSRALLRDLLRAATGHGREAWDVSARAGAAPEVMALHAHASESSWHASLSHRLDWVAVALSDAPVGIDVECDRPTRSDPAERAALMLSPAEMPHWASLATTAREAALLTCWTVKEAWFKASPPGTAPWDFRHVAARACAPADANVRAWTATPLHVALCSADARALMTAHCDGLDDATAHTSFWHVHRVAPAT